MTTIRACPACQQGQHEHHEPRIGLFECPCAGACRATHDRAQDREQARQQAIVDRRFAEATEPA